MTSVGIAVGVLVEELAAALDVEYDVLLVEADVVLLANCEE